MSKGNAIVGQSGGPTSVINASLAGIVQGCGEMADIGRILGMRWGIEGFMGDQLVDLSAQSASTIEGLRRTPSSVLGSSRHKLQDADFPKILDQLRRHDIHTIFMIGGNDTMDTIHRVTDYAAREGYELRGIGVPKTVDNDLFATDHTPGYPSAARYTALSVQQAGRLARDMQKVDQFTIYQSIGRDSGWLTAAGALAKRSADDAPHLVYMPERAFDEERFLDDVADAYARFGYVAIVCGEGIRYADGTPVSASRTTDKFANVEFGAMGGASVGLQLHRMVSDRFGWRGEFQITESLPMCAIDRAVESDLAEAHACGREAARLAGEGATGVMVTIVRESSDLYRYSLGTAALEDVAVRAKPMPDAMINEDGNFPSEAFFGYARPLVGDLPEHADLDFERIP
ncbi:MAG: diphosphate--fructose-6-phosphate 1-phosphotransferase [Gemmatimonadetes bacterium]|nr:diphosphate--fructose-6-phosphate 1-phosphotransferase [Gemmatimonadota bacterium]NNF37206.1 diphosphate--fructose-6-phosphate 1-phosphotransferase [Gemmatimonadota bacterium]NNK63030.1 diphosphate--fructose-6-phosphate 1-phosphotransferase [Gemmatimonadota bacterium]